jgi:adenine phosphoribosyltransferase
VSTTGVPAALSPYRADHVHRHGVAGEARDVRVVHELDGITAPVTADRLAQVGAALWQAHRDLPDHAEPDLLFGLDAGGIPPTLAVAAASGLPYQLAWKLDLALPNKAVFHEPHARRVEVFSYAAVAGLRVVLVDDEVTTGSTLANLTAVLRAAGAVVTDALCLVEDRTAAGRSVLAGIGVRLCALTTL